MEAEFGKRTKVYMLGDPCATRAGKTDQGKSILAGGGNQPKEHGTIRKSSRRYSMGKKTHRGLCPVEGSSKGTGEKRKKKWIRGGRGGGEGKR